MPAHPVSIAGAAIVLLVAFSPISPGSQDPGRSEASYSADDLRQAAWRGDSKAVEALLAAGCGIDEAAPDGSTALLIAIRRKDAALVRLLLEKGASIQKYLDPGFEKWANRRIRIADPGLAPDLIEELIGLGTPVAPRNGDGHPTWDLAVTIETGNKALAAMLVAARCPPMPWMPAGIGFQLFFEESPPPAVLSRLVEKGADCAFLDAGWGAIHLALKYCDDLEILRMLVDRGADIEDKTHGFGRHRWRPLHVAAFHGKLAALRFLVEKGAKPGPANEMEEVPPKLEVVPLGLSASKQIAEFLLGKGAELNARGTDGYTALHVAAGLLPPRLDVVEFLVAKGLSPECLDESDILRVTSSPSSEFGFVQEVVKGHSESITPLHLAKTPDVAKFLVEKGSDIEARARSGWAPLHQACLFDHGHNAFDPSDLELALAFAGVNPKPDPLSGIPARFGWQIPMIRHYLAAGVDPDLPAGEGSMSSMSPLILGAYVGPMGCHRSALEALLKGGADALAVDSGSSSALHYAVENGDLLTARLLLEHGADVDRPDRRGRTPLKIAIKRNCEEMIGLLRAARKKDDRKERGTPETGRAQGRG